MFRKEKFEIGKLYKSEVAPSIPLTRLMAKNDEGAVFQHVTDNDKVTVLTWRQVKDYKMWEVPTLENE